MPPSFPITKFAPLTGLSADLSSSLAKLP